MSRIDEALRRAAGEAAQAGDAAGSVSPDETGPMDVHSLAREPFPLEMPKRGAAATPAPAPSAPAAAPPHAASGAAMPTPPRMAPRTPSIGIRELHLAHAPQPSRAPAEKLVTDPGIPPVSVEQYRRLAGTLHQVQNGHGIKVVMIASAVQGEGKTLTAANLALTFSESYQRRVLLIDTDLRRPSLHSIFNVDNSTGLSELMSAEHPQMSVREVSQRLSLLPAGPATPDPMAGLTSSRMRRVIDEAREGYDWVILDTPPLVLMSDANLLSEMVDGAVLVVRAESTPFDLVNRAVAILGRERIFGVVLNGAQELPHGSRYGYYNYGYPPTGVAVERA